VQRDLVVLNKLKLACLLGLISLGVWATPAQAIGTPAECLQNGGALECKKADIWFISISDGRSIRYPTGWAACSGTRTGVDLRNFAFWAMHPRSGANSCEYDLYDRADKFLWRQVSGNWVSAVQRCPVLASLNFVDDWIDTADNQEDYRGRMWCQYGSPEERSCKVGSPVLPGTGREVLSETDYSGAGAHSLAVVRHYRSFWNDGAGVGMAPVAALQGGWMLSVQSRVSPELPDRLQPTRRVSRPDGELATFYGTPTPGLKTWRTQDGSGDQLIEQRSPTGQLTGWQYRVAADDSTETFDASGRLQHTVQRNGWRTTLAYSTPTTPVASYLTGSSVAQVGQLISVRNHFGRELQLVYDAQGRISQLLPPGAIKDLGAGSPASPIRYSYDEAASLGATPTQSQLTSVTWQDGSTRRYHYEDPRFSQALTGETDELGVRQTTRRYDAQGRVAEESKAGGVDRLQFSYTPGSLGQGNTTTVTDQSGPNSGATQRTYTFQTTGGVMRPKSVSAPCPLCGTTKASSSYNARGQATRTVAHDGSVVFYLFDAQGREVERAEFSSSYTSSTIRPPLSAARSVTSTVWHPTWNVSVQVAEPGKLSTSTYNGWGQLVSQSSTATLDNTGAAQFNATKTGPTQSTAWAYDSNALPTTTVERSNGVETGRWTTAYNALGDITQITDATNNRTARIAQYDANGRFLAGITDTGVPISLTYAPRGFVRSKTVNGKVIAFTQNQIGLTTLVAMPDRQTLGYVYDPIHRLTSIQLNGAAITPQMLAQGEYPDTLAKAYWAQVRESLIEGFEGLIPTAWAQGVLSRAMNAVVVVPGQPMPGQPEFDVRTDMMMVPISRTDKTAVKLAEKLARVCECKPGQGYPKPTFTLVTFAHVLFSGHLSARFSDKSYFASTEKVGQALVDEVMLKALPIDRTPKGSRMEVVADLRRTVGYDARRGLIGTSYVTVVYEANNCSTSFRGGNEVVTMYPGRP
jgi:hypothetical protein